MAYTQTGVGISNVTRTSRTTTGLVKDYGGADADEVQLLNGLIALGYDPNLIRSFSDRDPNRRFLGDAVARALRDGVSSGDIERALAYNKVAVEDHSLSRTFYLAKALGLDAGAIEQEARRLAGMQGRQQPTIDQWTEAARTVGGFASPEAIDSFTRYARSEPAEFVGKGAPAPGAPAPTGDFREQRSGAPMPAPGRPAPPPPGGAPPSGPTPSPRPLGGGGLGDRRTPTAPESAGIRNLPTLAPNASEEEVIKYIRRFYGYASWVLDVPELRARMIEVARDFAGVPVDEATIMGRFTDLEWWKTHSDQQRLAIEERSSDPATYNAKVEGKFREVASITGQLGFTVSEGRLRTIARDAYDQGWNTAEMRAALAAEFDYSPETGDEDQSRIVADLRTLASDYLVPLGEATIDQWGRQIIAGTSTAEDFTAYAKSMAKGMFAHWAQDIDAGRTVKQIADPFVQVAMKDLELTEDQVKLMDPKWRRALELDPETGQPMQLSKWQRLIRSDSSYRWNYTQGARAEASEFASKIAEAFGRA